MFVASRDMQTVASVRTEVHVMYTVAYTLYTDESATHVVACASELDALCVYDALVATATCMFVYVHDATRELVREYDAS